MAVVLGNRANAIWTLTGTSAKMLKLSIASSKFCLEAKPAKQRAVVLQYMCYFRVVAWPRQWVDLPKEQAEWASQKTVATLL